MSCNAHTKKAAEVRKHGSTVCECNVGGWVDDGVVLLRREQPHECGGTVAKAEKKSRDTRATHKDHCVGRLHVAVADAQRVEVRKAIEKAHR